ncbi:MAG TPA: 2-oxoacid:acceptor oxidoreductase family protein [Methanotrichaceae archaeon]|nr:2-oxoacid:acceptor oxidoreductase family protein [Methanotrichaceae archaeon]
MIEIRWHGRGGQGAFTASRLLGAAASLYEGKYGLAFPSFGPERRGAPVQAFTKIDVKKIDDRSEITAPDYIVILDETLAHEGIVKDLKENGNVIINSSQPEKYAHWGMHKIHAFDATSLALEVLKKPITNTAMLGALIAVSGVISLDSAIKGLQISMGKSLLVGNIEVLKRAYELNGESIK